MNRAIYEICNIHKSGNGYDSIIGVNRLLVDTYQMDFLLKRGLQFTIFDLNDKK